MRVAICWELGGNYGHITGLAPLARALRSAGAEPVFILRDLRYSHLLGADVLCVQAPLPAITPSRRDFGSYTDILASIGYDDLNVLTPYVLAWRNLFERYAIECVVAEHAPTALFAARLGNLSAFAIGSGFALPPVCENEFSPFNSTIASASESAARVLSTINAVLAAQGLTRVHGPGDLFSSAQKMLCCFPELDHYPIRAEIDGQDIDYWGPLFSDDIGREVFWQAAQGPRIFAYLTGKVQHLDQLVAAIAQLPGEKLLHIAGEDCSRWASLANRHLHFFTEPLRLAALLSDADMAISQGGLGLTSLSAIRGCRQVIIPTQTEQRMLARRLFAQKLAYVVEPDATEAEYLAVLIRALACPSLAAAAQAFCDAYGEFDQDEQLAAMAEEILAH